MDQKTVINILHKEGISLAIEIQTVDIKWGDEDAQLVSLRDITDHKNKEDILYNLSISDDLTTLYNRRGLYSLAERYIKSASKLKRYFTIFFIDIDDLKQINDSLGHGTGSLVISHAAAILKNTFRNFDIISRYGGDEFVVLSKGMTKDSVELIKNRLKENINNFNKQNDWPFVLSMSVGASFYDPSKPTNIEELIKRADLMMYRDKQCKQMSTPTKRTALYIVE